LSFKQANQVMGFQESLSEVWTAISAGESMTVFAWSPWAPGEEE
jgi:hypothetical protein